MELELKRTWPDSNCTIGELFIDGGQSRECYILEPPVREIEGVSVIKWKVPGHTAVPRGRYRIIRRFSPKHGKIVPWLTGIPGFEDVEIHSGNTAIDTKGCLLPGKEKRNDVVFQSIAAFKSLDSNIAGAIDGGEEVFIAIF